MLTKLSDVLCCQEVSVSMFSSISSATSSNSSSCNLNSATVKDCTGAVDVFLFARISFNFNETTVEAPDEFSAVTRADKAL